MNKDLVSAFSEDSYLNINLQHIANAVGVLDVGAITDAIDGFRESAERMFERRMRLEIAAKFFCDGHRDISAMDALTWADELIEAERETP